MAKKANKAKRGKDKYYHLAKEQGYRARSAFKLIQLNKKYDFLAKCHTLIDLCAAPGGWLQVAAKYMPSGGTIVGVDLMPIKPIRGVITHTQDITTPECRTLLKRDLAGKKCDVVLHDGAPNVGQNWAKDAFGQSELVLHSLKLASEFLRPKGTFITKVFRSADYNSLMWVFHQLFERVEATKPHSSRNASAEIFVVCREYKAPDRIDPRLLDLKHVFKDVAENTGTGKGMAGGGGEGTADVFHKKNTKERSREGYDETLGPLLTRQISVLDFVRARDPVRTLTDASAFVFDDEAKEAGVTGLTITTGEILSCCEDLKVLGKKDFKLLLKWRLAVRHALPQLAARPAKDEEDEDEEGDEDEGSAGEAEGDDAESLDSEGRAEAALQGELSAAAAEELKRRKREEKRKAKARTLAIKKNRLGMNLRSVDVLDTDDSLFSLARIKRLAASRGVDGDEALAELADQDLSDEDQDQDGQDSDDDEEDGEDDDDVDQEGLPKKRVRGHEGEDEEDGAGDDKDVELALAKAGSGQLFDALRSAKRNDHLDELEDELDGTYARHVANQEKAAAIARQKAESGKLSHGIKMTRRRKLEQQALLTEAALNAKLDAEHTRYLQLLAGARGRTITTDDVAALAKAKSKASGDDDSDDGAAASEDEDEVEEDGGDADEVGDMEDDEDEDGSADDEAEASGAGAASSSGRAKLPAAASRWFSQLGEDAAASSSGLSLGLKASSSSGKGKGKARVEDDMDSDSEEEQGKAGASSMPSKPAAKGKDKKGRGLGTDEAGNPLAMDDEEGMVYPDWMAGVPKSERDKRKDKLRKEREREAKRVAAQAKLDEEATGFATVKGQAGVVDDEFEAVAARYGLAKPGAGGDDDDMVMSEDEDGDKDKHALAKAARQKLIKAGMGKGAAGAAATTGPDGFEVVPAGESAKATGAKRKRSGDDSDDDSDDDELDSGSEASGPDPRLEDYDSDEHAELLALGKALKKHSTAKALLDASYNRYAFDDSANGLPTWFSQDESRHFRPQLPISKAEIDGLKAKFRDIAARPVHKVAEARARKKRRLVTAMEKAKKKASNILESEELGAKSKAKAIAAEYRKANARAQKKVVTQVNRHGKRVGASGQGGRGAKTRVVDPYMKKQARADKRKARHNKGKNANRRKNK